MSARRKKKHGGDHEAEHHVDERWAISYMDMVTVLMCLFIVLFAMSTVDAKKYEQLRNSLATGFGVEISQKVDTAKGVVVPPELVNDQAEGFTDTQLAQLEATKLEKIQRQIEAAADAAGVADKLEYVIDQRGLTVRLIGSEAYFLPDRSDLTPVAETVLGVVGPVLAGIPNQIAVEGHVNPVDYVQGGDWLLGADRAVSVVTFLSESQGVDGTRLQASSFGNTRPLTDSSTDELRSKNRRVDLVVISDAPESVRSLIPQAAQTDRTGQPSTSNGATAP